MNWTERVNQLLSQLEERARQCPGLYPVKTAGDFLRMVRDCMEKVDSPEETALWLEQLWHNPELSYQLNAQSLIRRGESPFNPTAGNSSLKNLAG